MNLSSSIFGRATCRAPFVTAVRHLVMAALAGVMAMTAGCSGDEGAEQPQPATADHTVTVTTTVSLDDGAATRALTSGGVKTFAAGEQIAVVYEQEGATTAKAVSLPLDEGDIDGEGRTATFTLTLTNPAANGTVRYIYPAAMADDDGNINYAALATQDGTLQTIASRLDLALFEGTMTSTATLPPSSTLDNQLAICAFTLKNATGSDIITRNLTRVTVSDGTDSYTVTPSGTSIFETDVIYLAMKPVATAVPLRITATCATADYVKTTTARVYEAGSFYNLGLRMNQAKDISKGSVIVDYGEQVRVTGTTTQNMIFLEDGATVTLDGVNINTSYNEACIFCRGSATIVLADGTTNTLTHSACTAIAAGPAGTTLTIIGSTGVLNVEGHEAGIGGSSLSGRQCGNIEIQGGVINVTAGTYCAGIGSDDIGTCGDITISGGTVTATGGERAAGIGSGESRATCGNITISGGTVTATGGESAAGIGSGSGQDSACGNITITDNVDGVTATAGDGNGIPVTSIGKGRDGTCGTVTIGGTVYPDGISKSPFFYLIPPIPFVVSGPDYDSNQTISATIYYLPGETWAGAIDNHPTENTGWKQYGYFCSYSFYRLFDSDKGDYINPNNPINTSGRYYWEEW